VKIAICAVVAAELTGTVKHLRWNRATRAYIEVPVDFTDRNVAVAS
jgi:hypothetical protein